MAGDIIAVRSELPGSISSRSSLQSNCRQLLGGMKHYADPRVIVAKHGDKFKDHIDSRISNIIERGIDPEIKDELSKNDGGVKVTKADGAALACNRWV